MISESKVEKVIEMLQRKVAKSHIAKSLGISRSKILKICNEIPATQNNNINRNFDSQVFDRLNKGERINKIIVELGNANKVRQLANDWREIQEHELGISLDDMKQLMENIRESGWEFNDFVAAATEHHNTKIELITTKGELRTERNK